MKFLSSLGAFFLDILETFVLSLAIFLLIYIFIAQPHQIKGDSMLPGFHTGEYILTNKVSYRLHNPQRGDVIVFKYPKAPQYDYIKRIIGLPGEEIEIKNGHVYIYNKMHPRGMAIEEPYLKKSSRTEGRGFLSENYKYKIPNDSYFVMGDNREKSSDSRQWGPLPYSNIIGKSWIRYWPPQAFAVIGEINY